MHVLHGFVLSSAIQCLVYRDVSLIGVLLSCLAIDWYAHKPRVREVYVFALGVAAYSAAALLPFVWSEVAQTAIAIAVTVVLVRRIAPGEQESPE